MKNEKIQKLIEKLAKECQKQNMALSLATSDTEGDVVIAQSGVSSLIAIAAFEQYSQMKEELTKSDCDCQAHRQLKELYGIETENTSKQTHTFVTDDPNEVVDILSRILRGEFE